MAPFAELLPGNLDLVTLTAISLGAVHRYGVLVRTEQCSGRAIRVQQGTLYPAPYPPERKGSLAGRGGTAANDRRARFDTLAPVGRRHFAEEWSSWQRLADAVGRWLIATPQEI